MIKIINGSEFSNYFNNKKSSKEDAEVNSIVNEIIAMVRSDGDIAVRHYSGRFEKSVPENFEVPLDAAKEAWENLKAAAPVLADALVLAADHIRRFNELQKEQFRDFETEMEPGLFTGQKIIPVDRAAIYVPAGRFPLISSALMGLIPAAVAKVRETILVSPPGKNGLPDSRILAAAHLAGANRIFAIGGAQAIAALAIGTETIPKVDLIVGAGNKYVAAAKRLLYGEVGIDFMAGPTDVLIITESFAVQKKERDIKNGTEYSAENGTASNNISCADLVAADLLAQAEHDPDACPRALVPDMETAEQIAAALRLRLAKLAPNANKIATANAVSNATTANPAANAAFIASNSIANAEASLKANGLIIIYSSKEEAIDIANRIAPEHLELHVSSPDEWVSGLRNYGSLFIGSMTAEVLGDYSAGINHTLPTSSSARFTGGLSVRNFLKCVTTLRCASGSGYTKAIEAAEIIAKAEGLACHAESACIRKKT